jgi:hypothetical protein
LRSHAVGHGAAVHALLEKAKIKPLIQMRSLWKEEPERMLPGQDGNSNTVYDEAGTLYCQSTPPDELHGLRGQPRDAQVSLSGSA